MTIEITPKGTHGTEMPRLPGPLMNVTRSLMLWFARHGGNRTVILTTTGAKTGRPHTIAVFRFPESGQAFLVVASNGGSARHPAWFVNIAKHPDQVWAELGKRKFKVRPELLKGAERQAAWQRVIATAPGYDAYQQNTDREIPIVRLVPDE